VVTDSGSEKQKQPEEKKPISNETTMKMMLTLSAEGPAFHDENGKYVPEEAVAEILEDLAAQLRSGTKMVDLHCDKLKAWNGQRVGAVLVAASKSKLS